MNKWYYERSSGYARIGEKKYWSMFWCDAEERLRAREEALKEMAESADTLSEKSLAPVMGGKMRWGVPGLSFVEEDERGRIERWSRVVEAIPSSWV